MLRTFVLSLFLLPHLAGQGNWFAGAYGGISTLSADGTTQSAGGTTQFSSYKPENGPTAVFFGGRHLNDWVSLMGSYGWNRNSVVMSSGSFAGQQVFWEQPRILTMHTVLGEGLIYFRPLRSRIRPYLSGGFGIVSTTNRADGAATIIGPARLPEPSFQKTGGAFRAAVGIDILLHRGFAVRYSFSETIQSNVTSSRLSPPGRRNLANFQNWFGFSYRF
jgi:hypothetical protein